MGVKLGGNYDIPECKGLMRRVGGGKVAGKPLTYSTKKFDNKGMQETQY